MARQLAHMSHLLHRFQTRVGGPKEVNSKGVEILLKAVYPPS